MTLIKAFGHTSNLNKNDIFNEYIEFGKFLKPYISDVSVDLYNSYKN